MSLSLVEKLALTGAFLGLVAMAVGTDEDPGLVAEQAEVLAARARENSAPAATGGPTPTVASSSLSSEAPPPSEAPPAADVNEGHGATTSPLTSEPDAPAPVAQPSSPPDDPASQRDMRKVLAAQS